MGKMSISIWSQQLLFLLPSLIFAAVLSIKPPENTPSGGNGFELPSLVSFQMGNYLNTNLCSVLQNLYVHPASHMAEYLNLHKVLNLLHHEEPGKPQTADPAAGLFGPMSKIARI